MKTVLKNLIFDLGAHRGLDTEFYLKKGFKVVAVEANPKLVAYLTDRFSDEISADQLHIVDMAFWNKGGERIKFHVNEEKDDWSSAFANWANKGNHRVTEITVGTTTIGELFDQFGVPHYIKCDIEGADEMFCLELHKDGRRPNFVSIEGGTIDGKAFLRACGYDRVQIVNQMLSHLVRCPQPAREGAYVEQRFNEFMSGLFGADLPRDRWVKLGDALDQYFQFRRLRGINDHLARGWLDFHFASSDTLGL